MLRERPATAPNEVLRAHGQRLQAYFAYYNHRRPHQSLGGQTPAQVFAQPSFTQL
ncbi:MAG: hypothetical protein EOO63_09360 [Hymenobacter sp.]|nr:MAG: hypothetical protein EOO63_09360 [Hymenobacter sp.]